MKERQEEQVSCATETSRSLVVLAIAYSYVFVLAAFTALAFLVGSAGFQAKPPRVTWQFVATFLGGTISFTLLQVALLYRFKPRDFWPQGPMEWLKCVSLVGPVMLCALASAFTQPWNGAIAVAACTLLLPVGIGMIPSLLCFRDWFKHRSRSANEAIRLRPVETCDLPRAIRSYFDAHFLRAHSAWFSADR